MRILFMGTPEFAVPSLKALAAEHELVGVVTQPDRRAGRGQRLVQSPVKVVALELGLPIFQPERISDPQVMEDLEGLGAELFVVVAFGQKIPIACWPRPSTAASTCTVPCCPNTGVPRPSTPPSKMVIRSQA